jgi:hypothetical protein
VLGYNGTTGTWDVELEDEAVGSFREHNLIGLKTVGGVFRTNAYEDGHGHGLLYGQLARVNHSCEPNAVRVDADVPNGVRVLTTRPVAAGAEVLVSYIDGDAHAPTAVVAREDYLRKRYGFVCSCERCRDEKAGLGAPG